MSVVDFYDQLAAEYHLIYQDWEEAVKRQGTVLDRLITEAFGEGPRDVLDCACGIGTQAIGLAEHGHRVVGTDISEGALERARRESELRGQAIGFGVADFRDLATVAGSFDVVINCDNALPHLMDEAEIAAALRAMAGKLRPGGLLIVSIRDYDHALVERSPTASGLIPGSPRRIVTRLHDWDDDGPMHTVHIFIVAEAGSDWTFGHYATRYRALTRAELSAAAEQAGFVDHSWLDGVALGFHQPLFTARLPEG
jgi:glycine/sarcosine N-methyltransferase